MWYVYLQTIFANIVVKNLQYSDFLLISGKKSNIVCFSTYVGDLLVLGMPYDIDLAESSLSKYLDVSSLGSYVQFCGGG